MLFGMRPGPILYDVNAPLAQEREKRFKTGLARPVKVRRIIDDEVQRTGKLPRYNPANGGSIRLVYPPVGSNPILQALGLCVTLKVLTVLALGDVDGYMLGGMQTFAPKGNAPAVPNAKLEDVGGTKVAPRKPVRVFFNEGPILVEDEALVAELPVVILVVFNPKHQIFQ